MGARRCTASRSSSNPECPCSSVQVIVDRLGPQRGTPHLLPARRRPKRAGLVDLYRYKLADHKITKVVDRPVLDASGNGVARYRGRLRGMPTPVDTNFVSLQAWEKLTFQGAPGVWTRRLVDFTGTFHCISTNERHFGTPSPAG